MEEYEERDAKVVYPVKIGFSDGSGVDENIITDRLNRCLVRGWGDCCHIGGIQDKRVAVVIVQTLNRIRPVLWVKIIIRKPMKKRRVKQENG